MAKQMQIRCDCGMILREKKTKMGEIETEAMVCPQCHFTTLTKQQAKKYVILKRMEALSPTSFKVEMVT